MEQVQVYMWSLSRQVFALIREIVIIEATIKECPLYTAFVITEHGTTRPEVLPTGDGVLIVDEVKVQVPKCQFAGL